MVGSCAGMREDEGTRWCPRSAKKRRNSSRIQVEVRGLPVIGRPRGRAIISSRRGRPYGRGLLLSGAAGAMGARQVEDRAALTGGPSAGVLETALEGALHLALRHVGGRFDSLQLQLELVRIAGAAEDRKSTRLNSSHDQISYAVFCLKKKRHDRADPCCSS